MQSSTGTDSIVGAIRDFFAGSSVIEDYGVNVDYLPNEPAYSIEVIPGDPVYKRYVDGGAIYQISFSFTANMTADGDPRTMSANEEFFNDLLSWVTEQDRANNFPELPNHKPLRMVITSSGYLYSESGDLAAYQATFQLLYL